MTTEDRKSIPFGPTKREGGLRGSFGAAAVALALGLSLAFPGSALARSGEGQAEAAAVVLPSFAPATSPAYPKYLRLSPRAEPLRFHAAPAAKPLYSKAYRDRVRRFGLYSTLAGVLLGTGAIIVAQSDPQASWAGNNGFRDARNRGALTMGIPAAVMVSAGVSAWIWWWVQERRQSAKQAHRQMRGPRLRRLFAHH